MKRWIDPIEEALAGMRDEPRALAVILSEYRPDLVLAVADALGLRHRDFRREVMAPAGAGAAELPLSSIDATIRSVRTDDPAAAGIVLQNVEALLAVASAQDRASWLAEFVGSAQPLPVILPFALFGDDVPAGPYRIAIAPDAVPRDNLMMRLWSAS